MRQGVGYKESHATTRYIDLCPNRWNQTNKKLVEVVASIMFMKLKRNGDIKLFAFTDGRNIRKQSASRNRFQSQTQNVHYL